MEKNPAVIYGEIVSRVWDDEVFKKRFLNSPKEVLKEAGIPVEEGVEYKVIEAPKMVQYLVLPHEKHKEALQKLAKLILGGAERGAPAMPEGIEVRVIQNTSSLRYLVLPASPGTLTEAELAMVAGGGKVKVQTHVVVATVETVNVAHAAVVAAAAVDVTSLAAVVIGVVVLI